jgi:(heptosyl)LPS beta-1,4-glucosyltransferase
MSRLTVTVIAWNEEERLRACLESVAWADEIVVVDAESTDKTVQIAREFTDKVSVRVWPGFATQKNFAIEQASGEWILSLDADERVTSELRERIRAILAADGPADGYAPGSATAGSTPTTSCGSSAGPPAASWRTRCTSRSR